METCIIHKYYILKKILVNYYIMYSLKNLKELDYITKISIDRINDITDSCSNNKLIKALDALTIADRNKTKLLYDMYNVINSLKLQHDFDIDKFFSSMMVVNTGMSIEDSIDILKVDETKLNETTLKKAYLKLAKKFHPDKVKKDGKTSEQVENELKDNTANFQRVLEAYQTLSKELTSGKPIKKAVNKAEVKTQNVPKPSPSRNNFEQSQRERHFREEMERQRREEIRKEKEYQERRRQRQEGLRRQQEADIRKTNEERKQAEMRRVQKRLEKMREKYRKEQEYEERRQRREEELRRKIEERAQQQYEAIRRQQEAEIAKQQRVAEQTKLFNERVTYNNNIINRLNKYLEQESVIFSKRVPRVHSEELVKRVASKFHKELKSYVSMTLKLIRKTNAKDVNEITNNQASYIMSQLIKLDQMPYAVYIAAMSSNIDRYNFQIRRAAKNYVDNPTFSNISTLVSFLNSESIANVKELVRKYISENVMFADTNPQNIFTGAKRGRDDEINDKFIREIVEYSIVAEDLDDSFRIINKLIDQEKDSITDDMRDAVSDVINDINSSNDLGYIALELNYLFPPPTSYSSMRRTSTINSKIYEEEVAQAVVHYIRHNF